MALKPTYDPVLWDINVFSTAVLTRGGIVCHTGQDNTYSPSGVAIDQSNSTGTYVANPSGYRAAGVAFNDVVNKDLTQTHLDQYKHEVQVGSKHTLLKVGVITTNMIETGQTPTVGQKAYIGHSGMFSNVAIADQSVVTGVDNVVGRFETTKDEDGFCRIYVNIN